MAKAPKDETLEEDDATLGGLQPLVTDDKTTIVADDDAEVVIVDDEAAETAEEIAAREEEEAAQAQTEADAEAQAATADAEVTTEEAPDDPEFKAFKPNVQKRIQREIRIRRTAEKAANLAVAKVREIEAQAETAATETAELRKSNIELQRQYADVLSHAFGNQIEVKQRDLKAARDAGNFETEQKLQGEIDDLRFKQNQVKDMQRQLPAADAEPEKKAPVKTEVKETPKSNPLAVGWVNRNKSWWTNPKFAGHKAFALTEDAKLAAEGYDQNSSEYYKELDARIDKAFPTLRRKPAANAGGTQPVAAVSTGSAPRKPNGKNTYTLKKSDLETMKMFNLDPTNKAHLREYARQLQEASATGEK